MGINLARPPLLSAFGARKRKTERLYRLIENFGKCLEDYNELTGVKKDRDIAYWYGERTLTGLLAGAVWRMRENRWALEEFISERQIRKKKKRGRGDLWFGLTAKEEYTVESKLYEPDTKIVWASDRLVRQTQKRLDKAFGQLSELKKRYRVGRPLAVSFLVPYIWKAWYPSYQAGKIFRQIAHSKQWKRSDTVVGSFWYSNGALSYLDKTSKPGIFYFAPGVIVVMQSMQVFPASRKNRS